MKFEEQEGCIYYTSISTIMGKKERKSISETAWAMTFFK